MGNGKSNDGVSSLDSKNIESYEVHNLGKQFLKFKVKKYLYHQLKVGTFQRKVGNKGTLIFPILKIA
jgi:hypothetical protein